MVDAWLSSSVISRSHCACRLELRDEVGCSLLSTGGSLARRCQVDLCSLLAKQVCSPQSNGIAESFVNTFKRDYGIRMDLTNACTVMVRMSDAFEHFNEVHPHSALRMKSPKEFGNIALLSAVSIKPRHILRLTRVLKYGGNVTRGSLSRRRTAAIFFALVFQRLRAQTCCSHGSPRPQLRMRRRSPHQKPLSNRPGLRCALRFKPCLTDRPGTISSVQPSFDNGRVSL